MLAYQFILQLTVEIMRYYDAMQLGRRDDRFLSLIMSMILCLVCVVLASLVLAHFASSVCPLDPTTTKLDFSGVAAGCRE